ncbi:MAG: MltA domain-containing protein, partial [Alphaproteobacteria bacterium]|nr:MltA domain-containing protein [Alphaproteobacteria bacterium]
KLTPYYTRKEIYDNGLNAPIILWGDSYIDIYIMQIQGSAVAKLPNGEKVRISFAESNGHKFKGIGSILLSKKLIPASQASMGNIKKWLKENFDTAKETMNENKRYIFHKIGNDEGPIGALGVDLTAGRSLAVDKTIIPLGAMLWLETSSPDNNKLNKLVMAQDIGSAIKGAIRGDYFWGSGGDDILEKAGKMNSKGQYYILIPKQSEITNGEKN